MASKSCEDSLFLNITLKKLMEDENNVIEECLLSKGLDENSLSSKLKLYRSGAEALIKMPSSTDEVACFWIPGRIEIAGKHTDYAGGQSLLAATSLGFCVVASRSSEVSSLLRVETLDKGVPPYDRCVEVDLSEQTLIENSQKTPSGHWSKYVKVALHRMATDFPGLCAGGVNIAIGCDLPKASGMSTSSALVCALYLVVEWCFGLRQRSDFLRAIPDECSLCDYLGCVENGSHFGCLPGGGLNSGVGTFGGSEDHTAIMCSSQEKIKTFSFCPTTFIKEYPFATDLLFVIASSGVVAEKTGGAMGQYNDAAGHARGIAERLGCNHLREVVDLYGGSVQGIGEALQGNQTNTRKDWVRDMRRVRQFIQETDITERLGLALSDIEDTEGRAVRIKDDSLLSHSLGEEALCNLVEATKWLPRRALQLNALGSSAFGAGFGGSVWAVVTCDMAESFQIKWAEDYRKAFPQHASDAFFFTMRPGPPACRL